MVETRPCPGVIYLVWDDLRRELDKAFWLTRNWLPSKTLRQCHKRPEIHHASHSAYRGPWRYVGMMGPINIDLGNRCHGIIGGSWSSTGDTPEQEYRHGPHGGTWSLNGHKTGVVRWVSGAFVKNSPWITYWMMYGSMGKRLYYLHLTWINMNSFTIIWIWPPMQNDVTNDTKNPIKYLAISILIACRYLFLSLHST